MEDLAEIVLDLVCFFEFEADEDLDSEAAHDVIFPVFEALRDLPAEQQTALRAAARERRRFLTTTDEHGYCPEADIPDEEFAFLDVLDTGEFFADG